MNINTFKSSNALNNKKNCLAIQYKLKISMISLFMEAVYYYWETNDIE